MLQNTRPESNTDSDFDAAQLYDWAVNSPTRFADYPDDWKLAAAEEAWRRYIQRTDGDALDVLRLSCTGERGGMTWTRPLTLPTLFQGP